MSESNKVSSEDSESFKSPSEIESDLIPIKNDVSLELDKSFKIFGNINKISESNKEGSEDSESFKSLSETESDLTPIKKEISQDKEFKRAIFGDDEVNKSIISNNYFGKTEFIDYAVDESNSNVESVDSNWSKIMKGILNDIEENNNEQIMNFEDDSDNTESLVQQEVLADISEKSLPHNSLNNTDNKNNEFIDSEKAVNNLVSVDQNSIELSQCSTNIALESFVSSEKSTTADLISNESIQVNFSNDRDVIGGIDTFEEKRPEVKPYSVGLIPQIKPCSVVIMPEIKPCSVVLLRICVDNKNGHSDLNLKKSHSDKIIQGKKLKRNCDVLENDKTCFKEKPILILQNSIAYSTVNRDESNLSKIKPCTVLLSGTCVDNFLSKKELKAKKNSEYNGHGDENNFLPTLEECENIRMNKKSKMNKKHATKQESNKNIKNGNLAHPLLNYSSVNENILSEKLSSEVTEISKVSLTSNQNDTVVSLSETAQSFTAGLSTYPLPIKGIVKPCKIVLTKLTLDEIKKSSYQQTLSQENCVTHELKKIKKHVTFSESNIESAKKRKRVSSSVSTSNELISFSKELPSVSELLKENNGSISVKPCKVMLKRLKRSFVK